MTKLKVLLSAYACEPERGSEPGVGWNWVKQIARHHETWVITRKNNQAVIEAELAKYPLPDAHFIYFDLPRWARFWKRRRRGLYLYYYLWQLGAYWEGRRLHRRIQFDLAHHVTFVMYWMPSFLSLLPVPYIWGPVGGGESIPSGFSHALGRRGRWIERLRTAGQALGRLDPFVRLTARRCALALGTTPETERRLIQLGCRSTSVCSVMGLSSEEIQGLGAPAEGVFRIASAGNLIAWKGVEFGLRAFAAIAGEFPQAEYWIIGDGPERARLEALAEASGMARRVRFLGSLPRRSALEKLAECAVLLLPSLHDSGSCVCTEAMALGRPVVCLDLGGPAWQVTEATGIKVPAHSPAQAVRDLAWALRTLALDPQRCRRMGEAGRERVQRHINWNIRGREFAELYRQVASTPPAEGLCYPLS